jgi:TRAP transporter 4TM/12TM fusion protein
MGSAAFIMAEMLGIKYLDVALAAAIPALLYYVALFVAIDFEAGRVGLKTLDPELVPNFWQVMKKGWFLLIPPSLLIILMLFYNYSAQKAGVWGIISIVVVTSFSKVYRMDLKKLHKAFMGAAKGALMVGAATAAMGFIIGIFGITGLGAKLSGLITGLAGGNLLALLILTMITSLILGMGVPTTAAYLILAVLVAPALTKMGVLPLAAHLFVFYFGIISAITPPVAVAAFAASAISGSDSWKTGLLSCRLGLTAFILPFMFVYGPELLGQGSPAIVAWTVFTAILGIIALAASVIGYFLTELKLIERLILLVAALILITPNAMLSVVGMAIMIASVLYQIYTKKNIKRNLAI